MHIITKQMKFSSAICFYSFLLPGLNPKEERHQSGRLFLQISGKWEESLSRTGEGPGSPGDGPASPPTTQ